MYKLLLTMLTLIALTIISLSTAWAELAPIGCSVQTYACVPWPDEGQRCSWGYQRGVLYTIDLQKTNTSPGFEIWEGHLTGKVGKFEYQIDVFQRREPSKKVNFLKGNMTVGESIISGLGENFIEIRHLNTRTNTGAGVRCSMDISPAD